MGTTQAHAGETHTAHSIIDTGSFFVATVSAHVAHALSSHCTEIFGVMGNGNAYLLDALAETDTRYTAVRHEVGAVVAAHTYFAVSGELGVATCTYGAGFTNTITALADAVRSRIPLVLVTGDAPTTGLRPWDVEQDVLASAVGAPTVTVTDADPAGVTVRAIEYALTRRRPVVLAIPYDIAAADAGDLTAIPPHAAPAPVTPSGPHSERVYGEIVERLKGAKKPFLLAGRGAWESDARDVLGELAEITGAVTASSVLGQGIFPDRQFDLGVAGGFGQDDAMALVREADVAVVIGASLNQFTMRFGELFAPETHVVQIDTADRPTNARVDTFVRSDARHGAEELVYRLQAEGVRGSGWRESVDFEPLRKRADGDGLAKDGRLDPRSVAKRLAESLPQNRVVVSDGGHFIGWSNTYWPVQTPDRIVSVGFALQSIGLGFPSVVGAARANKEAAIVLTTGDGGGLMALADLESAIRVAGSRGVAVVWNDAAYGAEVHLYGTKGLAEEPMRIPEANFAALAEAFGAEGVVVRTLDDLDRLDEWSSEPFDSRRFLLLDCRVSPLVRAPYQEEIIRVNGALPEGLGGRAKE